LRASNVFIACVALTACTAGRAADPLPEPVAFLTDGLAAPYFLGARMARLTKICATQFSQQCRAEHVTQEDLESVDPAVFERVTVLGSEPGKTLQFDSWTDFAMEMTRTRDEFMREYLAFEKELVPRIGAVQAMCPDSVARRAELLDTIRQVNFSRYWPSSADEYQRTLAGIDESQARYLAQIRKQWSPEQCIVAREFAFDLIRLFSSKLRPFLHDDWVNRDRGDRAGAGVVNVWFLGMRAEGAVHPGVFADALEHGPKITH
jgi:hypothetical protein